MRTCLIALFVNLIVCSAVAQQSQTSSAQKGWWKQNNLRVLQTNLPDYEAASLDPDSLVNDLVDLSANTLLINAGGIMAFYPSKLDFEYINPYMKPKMLGDVIRKCHQHGIKVMVRFDFSRVHETIFKAHPDWCYISPKGERLINTNMYAVSINGPYVQECAFKIVKEVMDLYPIDGVFLNMPGYQVNNSYEGKYMGVDQNEYDKKSFYRFSNGMSLPVEENKTDPVYQKYLEFKKATVDDWSKHLYELVKAKNPQIAICTYSDKYVDIIRHEAQANASTPYWPYISSDNVNNGVHSFPDHIISNGSIQQISFQSRYNAIEPEEISIRLFENIANGSGLDVSLMGDFRNNEDPRNFRIIHKIYAFHKKFEPFFGNYKSTAKIALVAPGIWPAGLPMQEYRGIQLMLKEAHIPFDVIDDEQIHNLPERIKSYHVLIFPDINYLDSAALSIIKDAVASGINLIATNTAFFDNESVLNELFGAKIVKKDYDGSGNYLKIDSNSIFKRLAGQKMIFMKYNLAQYDLSHADSTFLPILAKGRPGPPEIIGGHIPTGFYAMGLKKHGKEKAVIMPFNIGRLYYLNGYKEHKNIFLDVLNDVCPEVFKDLQTDAPEKVEVILQQYGLNVIGKSRETAGLILHLVNLTGFSGASYFKPIPVYDISFKIHSDFRPAHVAIMSTGLDVPFSWKDGYVSFKVRTLDEFNSVLLKK